MIEAILLSRLKHRNLVQFLGLYSMRRNKDLDMTYIVSPWMDNGDVVQSMGDLTRRKASIPRIRWVSLSANTYDELIHLFRTRSMRFHVVSYTCMTNVLFTGIFTR